MADHERAAPSARPASALRWWLLLGLVLAVLVTGTAVGLRALLLMPVGGQAPAPTTAPPGPVSDPTPLPPTARPEPGAPVVVRAGGEPLLPGTATGQVYAQSAAGIFRIELDTGRVTRTPTPELEEHVTFLAGKGWVLVKSRWSATGVLVRDGRPAEPLGRQLDGEGFLHRGPGGRLWMEPEPSTDPRATTTLRLVDLDGRPAGRSVTGPRAMVPYEIVADGFGGLLLANRDGVFRLEPARSGRAGRTRLVSPGELVAAGGRRLLVRDCDTYDRCRTVLVDQRTRHRTDRPAAGRALRADGGVGTDNNAFGEALLSPDGRRLAVTANDSDGVFRAHVIDLRTGRDALVPGVVTGVNVNRQLAWSADSRWLLALTDHRLRTYDTRTHAAGTFPLTTEPLLHLTSANAPGW